MKEHGSLNKVGILVLSSANVNALGAQSGLNPAGSKQIITRTSQCVVSYGI